MSQTWNIPMSTSDTLSASRSYINDALAALQSSFSGSSEPSSPVAGQWFLDTDDNKLYIYSGSSWRAVGDLDYEYLGLQIRGAGVSYPFSDDVYMGSNQIKNLADPAAAQDAVTLNYLQTYYLALAGGTMGGDITMGANDITMDHNPTASTDLARKAYVDLMLPLAGGTMGGDIAMGSNKVTGLAAATSAGDAFTYSQYENAMNASSGHDHSGDTNDGASIEGDDLISTTIDANKILGAVGDGTVEWKSFIVKQAYTAGSVSVASSYTAVQSLTVSDLEAGDTVILIGFACMEDGNPSVDARIQNTTDAATIKEKTDWFYTNTGAVGNGSILYCTDTGRIGSKSYEFQMQDGSGSGNTAEARGLMAIVI